MPAGNNEVVVDPAVQKVHESYEQSLTYFMGNISQLLSTYNDRLQEVLPHNSIMMVEGQTAEAPAVQPRSPLLKRVPLTAAELKEREDSAIGALKKESAMYLQTFRLRKPANIAAAAAAKAATATAAETTTTKKLTAVKTPDAEDQDKKGKATPAATDEQLDAIAMPPLLLLQLKQLKQEARSLGKIFDQMHDWIALNIPMMKEEDNIGVAVMAQVIGELEASTAAIREQYELETSYLTDRNERELKYLKCSEATSVLQSIEVCDAETWNSLEKGWRVLMRIVLMTHSTLAKNMKALKDPRGAKRSNLHL